MSILVTKVAERIMILITCWLTLVYLLIIRPYKQEYKQERINQKPNFPTSVVAPSPTYTSAKIQTKNELNLETTEHLKKVSKDDIGYSILVPTEKIESTRTKNEIQTARSITLDVTLETKKSSTLSIKKTPLERTIRIKRQPIHHTEGNGCLEKFGEKAHNLNLALEKCNIFIQNKITYQELFDKKYYVEINLHPQKINSSFCKDIKIFGKTLQSEIFMDNEIRIKDYDRHYDRYSTYVRHTTGLNFEYFWNPIILQTDLTYNINEKKINLNLGLKTQTLSRFLYFQWKQPKPTSWSVETNKFHVAQSSAHVHFASTSYKQTTLLVQQNLNTLNMSKPTGKQSEVLNSKSEKFTQILQSKQQKKLTVEETNAQTQETARRLILCSGFLFVVGNPLKVPGVEKKDSKTIFNIVGGVTAFAAVGTALTPTLAKTGTKNATDAVIKDLGGPGIVTGVIGAGTLCFCFYSIGIYFQELAATERLKQKRLKFLLENSLNNDDSDENQGNQSRLPKPKPNPDFDPRGKKRNPKRQNFFIKLQQKFIASKPKWFKR